MADFRVDALFEAQKCMKLASKQTVDQPEFWGNLLSAVGNASIASVADSVVSGYLQEKARKQAKMDLIREHLTEKLNGD